MTKRNTLIATVLIALAGLSVTAVTDGQPEAKNDDEQAIKRIVQLYFDGIIEYDEAKLREAFHPDAYIIGTDKEGALDREPFQEWVLYTRGKAPDPTGRNNKIVSIDIAGRAAVAKRGIFCARR